MKTLYYVHDPDLYDKDSSTLFKKGLNYQKDKLRREFILSKKVKIEQNEEISENDNKILQLNNNDIPNDRQEIEFYLNKTKYSFLENFLTGGQFKKGWFSWITYKIFGRSKVDTSIKNFFNGREMLKHDLNILVILKKLIDFEVLFKILLDDYQIETCKAIHPRIIHSDMKVEEVIDGYRKIISKDGFSNRVSINKFYNGYMKCLKSTSNQSKNITQNIDFKSNF